MVRTKNLGLSKKLEETVPTPSSAPPAASVPPPAVAKPGDSSLPQRESQAVKPKRPPKQVARKSVRPYRTWTSSSESSKESPPPLAVPPPAASMAGTTPTGPSTRTRAQQASAEKELQASQSREKSAPPAKKKLKTNPPSASSKLEPEPPRSKTASAAKASAAAKGKQPMEDPPSGNIPSSISGCPTFYYRDNERDWNLYATRKFESERNYDLHAHRVYGIVKFIQFHQWEHTLTGFIGFIANIIKEFYANLTDDFLDENSRLYRRVYVRGHWFSFSEKDIAQALQLPENVSNAVMSMDRDLMHSELTGARSELKPGESLRITHLTFAHASLMRFALSNWVPNSNKTVVSQEVATLLYRITSGTSIDLASHILNQIVSFRRGKKPTFKLVFPNLIYKVLSSQKNVAQAHETLEPPITGPTFQPSEYFDGVFQKRPKAGAAAASAGASSGSAAAELLDVKSELQNVYTRLEAMADVQHDMSRQLSTLIKLYKN
ncbi:hypothetical protein CsatB_006415 [Cannabis sativa]